ncbi:2Fe-2S iron-sulfur cluster-binding protein [Streptomyces sp. CC219B]|uniref:2Fe-2S iron-sulfur cluster-binding protein n=1 Tax=Streptomyces sp. CC219B TaxID=3044574 RepID=UPI0024A91163|nr:2Fe-2S iron-sulfur cluster-binding protein [Streptomyces sp. CC219B]
MTDDRHGEGTPQGAGRWDPLPQGEYDDGATAFVQLPEGGIDALLASSDSPLAAPGHGYVPPPITVTPATTAGTDPAATGTWTMPAGGAQWPEPDAVPQETGDDRFTYDPGATGQWTFENAAPAPGPGHDVTGEWSIPVAGGDLPDESGEFTTSSLVEQWGGTPPPTLPGGAPAPWATQAIGEPWGPQTGGPGTHPHTEPTPHGTHTHVPAEGDGAAAAVAQERAGDDAHARVPGGDAHARVPGGDAAAAVVREQDEDAHAHVPVTDAHRRVPAEGDGAAAAVAQERAEDDVHAHVPGDDAHARVSVDAEPVPDQPVEPESAAVGSGTGSTPEDTQEAAEERAAPEGPEGPRESDEGATEAADEAAGTEASDASDGSGERPALPGEEHPLASYVLRVNGVDRPVTDAWIGESLLYVLRERLGLAGAKDGCSQGECGACNVQVDGRLVASCLVPAVTAAGSEVRTVEGLAVGGQPSDVQRALARCGAVQCGFCVPGMAMTVHDLLEGNPAPTELETRQALCGNLCRCSGYRGVVEAVKEVVAAREAHRTADSESDPDEARIPHQAGPGAGGVNPSAFEDPASAAPHDQAYGQDGGQA